MIYGSVCSGIEAATVAWHPLGWRCAFVSEIDKFPRLVLQHRWPEIPLHGDFTTIQAGQYADIDLLVGGTPCQDFSVAGLRAGLAGDRGNLSLEFFRLARRLRPRWLLWENVPGVLSQGGGRDFGAILGAMAELGYGWAYRVLDAQYFGVPQRRRRVFVVGHLGDWRRAAAVLFERHCLSGHPPPRREAGQRVAGTIASGAHPGSYNGRDAEAGSLIARCDTAREGSRQDYERETLVTHALRADGFDAGEDGTGRWTPLVTIGFNGRQDPVSGSVSGAIDTDPLTQCVAFSCKDSGLDAGEVAPSLRAMGHGASHANAGGQVAVSFVQNSRSEVRLMGGDGSNDGAFAAQHGVQQQTYVQSSGVRRLTPRECERLQGFPDDYSLIPVRKVTRKNQAKARAIYNAGPSEFTEINGEMWSLAADGPRYKALGNSMAVPVMRWIGRRIELVDSL